MVSLAFRIESRLVHAFVTSDAAWEDYTLVNLGEIPVFNGHFLIFALVICDEGGRLVWCEVQFCLSFSDIWAEDLKFPKAHDGIELGDSSQPSDAWSLEESAVHFERCDLSLDFSHRPHSNGWEIWIITSNLGFSRTKH